MPESQPPQMPVVSKVLSSLPLRDVFAAPLVAAIEAHNVACSALEQFIEKVGRDTTTGQVRTLLFRYAQQDGNGGTVQRTIELPMIAVLPLPAFGVDRLTVDFDVRIDAGESDGKTDGKELGGELGVGFGPVSLKLKGAVSSKSEQTRKTDTSARYTVHMEASRQPMPEAFLRIIDSLVGEILPKATPAALPAPRPGGEPPATSPK